MPQVQDGSEDTAQEGHHSVEPEEFGLAGVFEGCYVVNRLSEANSRIEAPTRALAQHKAQLRRKKHHDALENAIYFHGQASIVE